MNKWLVNATLIWLITCSAILVGLSIYSNEVTFIALSIFSCTLTFLSLIETIQIYKIQAKENKESIKTEATKAKEKSHANKRNLEI
jgi:hypothetical protein